MKLPSNILKFLITGGLAAFSELVIFIVMTKALDQSLVLSQSVSFLAGFMISFYLNRSWVFSSRGKVRGELPSYALLALINLLVSNLAISALVYWGLPDYMAKIILMGTIACWNYIIFRKIIFSASSRRQKER